MSCARPSGRAGTPLPQNGGLGKQDAPAVTVVLTPVLTVIMPIITGLLFLASARRLARSG